MKKIFVALSMVAFLAGCDDSSSASAENSEPAALSSAEKQGRSSSSRHCEECNDEAISSDSNAESNGSSRSSSSEQNVASSSSEKLSETSSSSVGKAKSSSSVVTLANPCKTETEDNCEYGTVLDDRDGQIYKTVKIGDQWWMAENLNYETDNSFCFKDSAEYCEKYGRLYTWAAAMDSAGTWSTNGKGCGFSDFYKTCSPTYPVRGVCPEGWHLPTQTEWNTLFTAVGGQSTAGQKLKAASGWNAFSSITNEDTFGFSALPAGYRDDCGDYYDVGYGAYFWSSTEGNSSRAYLVNLYYGNDYADLYYNGKNYGRSVRCVKD
ncbi:FISUMP domain-containing protein [Fibrobacter sp.]|uniref:FISUMP domain-containing protein n=1 Tax=Fibrobacter sp. TaxID=35828 RepID=UPI00260BE153|nr:FISUMP domain-containing protein [Fibrobacter sp.]MDD5943010.1 FISUMP domain-containing protein [Fibrobacter sp.]